MSAEAELALMLVRGINTVLSASRNFGLSYAEVEELLHRAETEDRELTLDDIQPLADKRDAARDRLKRAIDEARRS